MTVKYIPGEGEFFKGYEPAVKKVLHVTYGPASTNDVQTADCGTFTLVDVGMPIIVHSVNAWIATAFDASVTGTIGDSGDVDRYMDATTLGDTTVDTAFQADSAAEFWDTAGLDIAVVVAGATPTVGVAHIFVEYSEYID